MVVDASVVVGAVLGARGFDIFGDEQLVAPPLLWSEARSVLHAKVWRGDVPTSEVQRLQQRLAAVPVGGENPSELGAQAWAIADELGWARTYDAEYVALARILGCRLVTADTRLRRGADRLGLVVGPTEL